VELVMVSNIDNNVKESMKKIGEILSQEFPYSKIIYSRKKVDGHYNVHLEFIKPDDVNKFIEVAHRSIKIYGLGIDVPVRMRYKKISEN